MLFRKICAEKREERWIKWPSQRWFQKIESTRQQLGIKGRFKYLPEHPHESWAKDCNKHGQQHLEGATT